MNDQYERFAFNRSTARALCQATLAAVLSSASLFVAAQTTLQSQLNAVAAAHHGKVALFAENLKTGETAAIDADRPVQTASVIKITILLEAMDQIRNGQAALDEKIVLHPEDRVAGSGLLALLDAPLTLTLKDVLTMMVVVSDNTATNLAIDRLGLDRINAHTRELGLKDTYLYKKVYKPATGPMPADQPKFGLGKTTAREMALAIEKIGLCQLGTKAHPAVPSDAALCDTALTMLRNQFYRDGIPRYIEGLDSSESGSAIANKTGALDAVRNDVGLVASKTGLIVVSAFTYENADHSWASDDEGDVTIAKLSRAIVQAWSPSGLDVKAFEQARQPGYGKPVP
jgi:beta-lactamase class A